MPLGRTSGPNPPNWGNDSVFFWTRLIDFVFLVAIPGSYFVNESLSAVVATVIQFAIEFSITSWLRRRRRRWWERSQRPGAEAVA